MSGTFHFLWRLACARLQVVSRLAIGASARWSWRFEAISIEKRENVLPLCPHCKAELGSVCFQDVEGMLGRRYIYFCPECRCTLGVSHRKGFRMG
jgi:Zn-finger nucleic acid-binding protein